MRKLSILFTNNTLSERAGSETYLRDVALALLGRGHHPVAFSLVLGPVADELRRGTVPVVDDLRRLSAPPDVIHGHHHLETLMAALRFPDVPIVHFCHGWIPWEEKPLRHPSIQRYVAVDEVCLDRLVREEGIPVDRVEVLLNFVDLERFRPREALPTRPRRALVFSNSATATGYARVIERACAAHGISLDIVGLSHGNPAAEPEVLLAGYDLVFAKARAALEAMAVGCGVILSDTFGCGPLVTPDAFERLRMRNFGIRELHHHHDVAWYEGEIAKYDVRAIAEVRTRVRSEAGLERAVDRLLNIYADAMAQPPNECDLASVMADYLRRIAEPLKSVHHLSIANHELARRLEAMQAERDTAERLRRETADLLRTERLRTGEEVAASARTLSAASDRERVLQARIAAYEALPTLRIRNEILRIPLLGGILRVGSRYLANRLGPRAVL
jgi:glycosyltransferase involved in cell wall biosynthesis